MHPMHRMQHQPPKPPMDAHDLPRLMRRLMHRPAVRPRAEAGLIALIALATLAGLLALVGFAPPPAIAQQPERAASATPAARLTQKVTPAAPAARLTQKVTLDETSIDGPAWNGGLFGGSVLGWTGTDPLHHLNLLTRTGSLTFTNKLILGETSPFRPAVAEANVDTRGPFVVVAWTGTDPAHTLNVLWNAYGAPGSPQRKLTLFGETSIGAPGLLATPRIQQSSLLELAWTGTDANHSLNVLPLEAETLAPGTKIVLGQFSSNAGPNLELGGFAFSDITESVLAWTSRAQRLNLATSGQGGFTARPDPTLQAEFSAAAPSTIVLDNPPTTGAASSWLAWTGTDPAHHLNLRMTTNFPRWGGGAKTVLVDTAQGGPQIAHTDSMPLIAWTGTDPLHHLNVAQFAST
jgi:hypothetical protein